MRQRVAVWTLVFLGLTACGLALFDSKAETVDRLAEIAGLQEGMAIADLGAGDGDWTVELARIAGARGRILATEVDKEKLQDLRRRAKRFELGNIEVVEGDQRHTGLQAGCCDFIHVRNVYHHFQDPKAMLKDLTQALKPSGLIGIIDFGTDNNLSRGNTPNFRKAHGIEPETVIEEMRAAGFELVERVNDWQGRGDRFLLLFKRP